MIIVNLKGGLGNQMFQYAIGFIMALRNNTVVKVDLRYYEEFNKKAMPGYVPRNYDLDLFGIKAATPNKLELALVRMLSPKYHERERRCKLYDLKNKIALYERGRKFESRIFANKSKFLYLDGYWQSPKYLENYRSQILKLFNFEKVSTESRNLSFIEEISRDSPICINVRRADFINNPEHDCVNKEYYINAIRYFEGISGKKHKIYIFSDDIKWCTDNLWDLGNVQIIDHSLAGERFINYLFLMTKFNKFIIPNSTFAWWAAWLSTCKDKVVVAPLRWSGLTAEESIDIVPADWIRL